ncbi:MAG: NAD-dependent epimerase/dehydratase family protein [Deltaproteobacteria bacterium]|nr:NAD-dependent epimerase/dehydratase family protein [Candidatus Anaeroferrophillus wilburensis]MBN2889918.1 NAD-dependent epimerase/dehydratase family protein [Deltaproteobacteria bacterium]
MKNRVIAVTGVTGFIGSRIARHLSAAGWQVRGLVRRRSSRERLEGVAGTWIEGDLTNSASLRELVAGASAVIHCAGAVRGAGPEPFQRVNGAGVARLVPVLAAMTSPPALLLISSLAAREPLLSDYAASKRRGEQELAAAAGSLSWAIFRPPAVYGPGDRELVPLFRLMKWGIAPVLGVEDARFSLLHVDDLAAAVISWVGQKNRQNGTFELHDGRHGGYSWREVIDTVVQLRGHPVVRLQVPVPLLAVAASFNLQAARLLGYQPMLTPGKVRELKHLDWVCDNAPLHRTTGWVPEISLVEGLRPIVA